MVFRIVPSLGPDVEQTSTQFYWDTNSVDSAGDVTPSYQLGSRVVGSDGHDYVFVQAAAALDPEDPVTINETTWVATGNAGGAFEVPAGAPAVEADGFFHARRISEGFETAT